jgi:diacylglycerol kinase
MKILKSFQYAFNGLRICLSSEINFRIHVVAAIGAAAAGIWLQISRAEWLALLLCTALVVSLEMMNTAIETLCNFITLSHHTKIEKIKDVAAGAVLVAGLISLVCGIIIFVPKLIILFI